jgi:hypothetical protein
MSFDQDFQSEIPSANTFFPTSTPDPSENPTELTLPPFNSTQVYPYDPSADSGHIDVFTGISNIQKLIEMRERAIYDLNTLSYNPMASSGTGVIFPDAVSAKTNVESTLRVRPTHFKGPQQLDISENADEHFNRQINPRGWRENMDQEWYKPNKDAPFVGFPNPNYFNFYTDSIPTHNVQNLSHAQMVEALKTLNYDNDTYLNTVGSLLQSEAAPDGPAAANIDKLIQVDGEGINSDPRIMEKINDEYMINFERAKQIRINDATDDPRFDMNASALKFQMEQEDIARRQETQFDQIQDWVGIPTGYTMSGKVHV